MEPTKKLRCEQALTCCGHFSNSRSGQRVGRMSHGEAVRIFPAMVAIAGLCFTLSASGAWQSVSDGTSSAYTLSADLSALFGPRASRRSRCWRIRQPPSQGSAHFQATESPYDAIYIFRLPPHQQNPIRKQQFRLPRLIGLYCFFFHLFNAHFHSHAPPGHSIDSAKHRAISHHFGRASVCAPAHVTARNRPAATPAAQGFDISLRCSVGYPAPIGFRSVLGSHCNISV